MPEWLKGTVLKTVVGQPTVGSNPTLSATMPAFFRAEPAASVPLCAAGCSSAWQSAWFGARRSRVRIAAPRPLDRGQAARKGPLGRLRGTDMSDEYGVDLDEVFRVIDTADVLVVRFHFIDRRLLVDFRTRPGIAPLIRVVPRAESVEERFRSIKRLRPEFPLPERVMTFHWPRSVPVLLASGAWQRLVDRASALGSDETTDACARALEELMALERKEVLAAITGASHYQTLWERRSP